MGRICSHVDLIQAVCYGSSRSFLLGFFPFICHIFDPVLFLVEVVISPNHMNENAVAPD